MGKRPDTHETLLLALELMRHIPRGRSISSKDLHEQVTAKGFQRDLRSIQRQLDILSTHFDIERDDRSKPYGYKWKDNAQVLAVPNLSPQESLLLGLAEDYLRNLLPPKLMKSMEGFFSQARRNLGPTSNAKLEREWRHKVRFVATSQPLLPPVIRKEIFEAVSEALYANRYLEVDYLNAAGKNTQAHVMPLGLAQQGPRLYLVCRFDGYDNERSLAMHRIQSANCSTLTFERPKDFDLKRFDDDGRFGYGEGKRVKLSFEIERGAGLHLTESKLSEDQTVEDLPDGRLKITATVVETAMLKWWLKGFGQSVSVVQMTSKNRSIQLTDF